MIGDDINAQYETQFNHMIRSLLINSVSGFEASAGKRFRYRMSVAVIQREIRSYFGFVVKFSITKWFTKWIAEHGGWVGVRLMIYNQ